MAAIILKARMEASTFLIFEDQVKPKDQIKSVGIIADMKLTFGTHVNCITNCETPSYPDSSAKNNDERW